jgi:predicted nucleic acid-binding Zn ribbon protein
LELDTKLGESKALALWPGVVGAQLAAKTRAVSISRGRLVVEAISPAWANDCRMMSHQIREKLNQELGPDTIKSITFRVGTWT